MIRALALIAAVLWALPASPRAGLPSNNPALAAGCSTTYTGPGDIVSGAKLFYGLRGYNRAFVLTAGAALQLKRASDSATKDIAILCPSGLIDNATVTTFCNATTCSVTKWYDQTGNANPTVVATNQGKYFTACAAISPTYPCVDTGNGPTAQYVSTNTLATTAAPYSLWQKVVPLNYGGFGTHETWARLDAGANQQMYGSNGVFNVSDSGGTLTTTSLGMTYVAGVYNGASSFFEFGTNGSPTTISGPLTGSFSASHQGWMGETASPSASAVARFFEIAAYPSVALTPTQITNLAVNSITVYGF